MIVLVCLWWGISRLSADTGVERKWHRKTTEDKLRLAVFAAMLDSENVSISPTDIGRHAGLAKSLIYKYFFNVDKLVSQAVKKHLKFPPYDDLIVRPNDLVSPADAIAKTWDNILRALRKQPELLDIIGWSIGNQNVVAIDVVRKYRQFCHEVAWEIDPDPVLEASIFGLTVIEVCSRTSKRAKARALSLQNEKNHIDS